MFVGTWIKSMASSCSQGDIQKIMRVDRGGCQDFSLILKFGAGLAGQIRYSTGQDSRLWKEFIDRCPYLGYRPLPGAQ